MSGFDAAGSTAKSAISSVFRDGRQIVNLTTAVVVIGAGVVIGVSGLYVFFNRTNRQQQRQLAHLTRTIEGLRKDIGELKVAAKGHDRSSTNYSTENRMHSTNVDQRRLDSYSKFSRVTSGSELTSGDENDEFFDVSDDDNHGDLKLNNIIQHTVNDNIEKSDPVIIDDVIHTDAVSVINFTEIDLLLAGDAVDNELAYNKLSSQKDQSMTDPEFIWRLVRACYLCCLTASRLDDTQRERNLVTEGIDYSIAGLAIDNEHPDIHKWYAVMLGRSTDFLGIQDKIKNGFKFKEHLDHAIRLRPDDRTLYFMKGRWCYEVSMLSWMERKVAATLFATPPTSSLEEARQQFLVVERLYPLKWKENLLYIAKCLISEGNYVEAMKWLNKASILECESPEEEKVHSEVQKMLLKYKKYGA